MLTSFLCGVFWWLYLMYDDSRKESGLRWYEIKGITKFLFLGPAPIGKCRACDLDLSEDPIFRVELEPGVFYHEDCADAIKLEVGLEYPDWFLQPLPAEQEVAQLKVPVPTYLCAGCGFNHEEHYVCVETMEKLAVKPDPPGDKGDWFTGGNGGSSAAVGDYLPLSVNFRAAGEIACPNPRMNTVIINPLTTDELQERGIPPVRYCEHCKADHRAHEKCTFKQTTCAWCQRAVPPTPAGPGGGIVLCFHCIMWGRPPHPFDQLSDEELMAMFKRVQAMR